MTSNNPTDHPSEASLFDAWRHFEGEVRSSADLITKHRAAVVSWALLRAIREPAASAIYDTLDLAYSFKEWAEEAFALAAKSASEGDTVWPERYREAGRAYWHCFDRLKALRPAARAPLASEAPAILQAALDYLRMPDVTDANYAVVPVKGDRDAVAVVETHINVLTAQRDEARADRVSLTKALTGLTCSGSEFFIRRGDTFIADADACVAYVRRLRTEAQDGRVAAIRAQKAAEARVAELEAALAPAAQVIPRREEIAWIILCNLRTDVTEAKLRELLETEDRLTFSRPWHASWDVARRQADAILAVRPVAEGDAGWQPIETAPKDGTLIGVGGGCASWDIDDECWRTAVGHNIGRRIQWDVSHWKSLDPTTLPAARPAPSPAKGGN